MIKVLIPVCDKKYKEIWEESVYSQLTMADEMILTPTSSQKTSPAYEQEIVMLKADL